MCDFGNLFLIHDYVYFYKMTFYIRFSFIYFLNDPALKINIIFGRCGIFHKRKKIDNLDLI